MEAIVRVCLIGPESTGKTELAKRLADHLHTAWIPEFAREYALQQARELTYEDVEPIAKGEIANLESRISNPLFLDTDLLSTVVYSRHYYGRCPDWILEEARRRRADLYLLMDTDLPWRADAARDAAGAAREDLFDAFRAALDEFGARWVLVSGSGEERYRSAREAVEALLRS